MPDRESLPDQLRCTSCIIKDSVTGDELGYYDSFDEGIAAITEMVQGEPVRGRLLTLIPFDYGRPYNSILGEELIGPDSE